MSLVSEFSSCFVLFHVHPLEGRWLVGLTPPSTGTLGPDSYSTAIF